MKILECLFISFSSFVLVQFFFILINEGSVYFLHCCTALRDLRGQLAQCFVQGLNGVASEGGADCREVSAGLVLLEELSQLRHLRQSVVVVVVVVSQMPHQTLQVIVHFSPQKQPFAEQHQLCHSTTEQLTSAPEVDVHQ